MVATTTAIDGVPASGSGEASRFHALSLAIAFLGAAWMLLLAFGLVLPPEGRHIGVRLYDLYTAALLEGRLDLPLRELRLEGHYTPDGTGYLYHGLGPVLTRLPFIAFVEFPTLWIAPLSIWLWSAAGNICVHRTFTFALARAGFGTQGVPGAVRSLLAVAVWFGAPGIILSSNSSLFHEPAAMAYALGAGIVLLLVKVSFGAIRPEQALLPLSVLTGLVLHARPHLAAGYALALCLLALVTAWRSGRAAWPRVGAALCVLGLFGAMLIASNTLRFGDPRQMHGTFANSEVQYGWVYWGAEAEDSGRSRGFRDHGQFNVLRVPANAAMYLAAPPPAVIGHGLARRLKELFHAAGPWNSYVRVEQPNIGAIFLWPVWMLLMLFGLRQRTLWRMPALAGMLGVGAGGLLMLSYGTITLRYHVDLWPLIAFPAALGVAPLARWARSGGERARARQGLIGLTLAIGIVGTSLAVGGSRSALGDNDRFWTHQACLRLTALKGFDAPRREDLCRIGYP